MWTVTCPRAHEKICEKSLEFSLPLHLAYHRNVLLDNPGPGSSIHSSASASHFTVTTMNYWGLLITLKPRERAQLVRCLPCEHKVLNSIPRTHEKMPGRLVHTYNPSTGEKKTQKDPWGSLDRWSSFAGELHASGE